MFCADVQRTVYIFAGRSHTPKTPLPGSKQHEKNCPAVAVIKEISQYPQFAVGASLNQFCYFIVKNIVL